MQYEDVWLEVRACTDGKTANRELKIPEVTVIYEALDAASSANKHSGMWDYSRRLNRTEIETIQSTLRLVKTAEDYRSVSYSTDVTYKGSCYTLTLFAAKRSQ